MSNRELIALVDRALFPPQDEDEIELDEREFDDAQEEEEDQAPLR